MLKGSCRCCGRRLGANQLKPASNHMDKHVRGLRRVVESLAALKGSELLDFYEELRPVRTKLSVKRQQHWAARRKALSGQQK